MRAQIYSTQILLDRRTPSAVRPPRSPWRHISYTPPSQRAPVVVAHGHSPLNAARPTPSEWRAANAL
eukprot:559759-Prymnesium_polylepis.2